MAIFFNELSGSATSTGSFGSVAIDTSISESSPLTVDGTSGRLFSVTDQISGSVFSANLISGLPVIEAFSDNKVKLGPFSNPVHIDSSGKLGIGTNIPVTPLEVVGTLRLSRSSGSVHYAELKEDSGSGLKLLTWGNRIRFFQGASERMRIHEGGKVGINTGDIAPGAQLTVHGDISGSATSTGSFGHLRVDGEVSTQLKLRGSYTSTIKPYIRLQPNGSNSVLAFDGNNAPFFRSLSGIIFERRNDSSNHFYRYHAYFEFSSGRSYFNGSTMIHTDGSVLDPGDPKALLHVSGGNFYLEGGNISGSSTSTGSFGMLRVGESGANLFLRAKSANIAIGNKNTYPDFRDTSGGNYNIAIGTEVFMDLTSGERNTAVGYQAGRHNVGGDYNSFFGWNAGRGPTSGAPTHTGNTAVGYQSLFSLNTGGDNVAVGRNALYQLDKGEKSVGIGLNAGYYATGSYNTFVGAEAGKGATTSAPYSSGQNNVALGYQALTAFTTAERTTAVGYQAGAQATTSRFGVFLGYRAGYAVTTADFGPIAIGHLALGAMTDKTGNTAVGYETAYANNTATNATFIGWTAGRLSTGGVSSTIVGSQAGMYIVGSDITHIGTQAGYYATGSNNTFVGSSAGKGGATSAPYSTGTGNTALGAEALKAFTTGYDNVVLGYQAGDALTTGYQNVVVGKGALGVADDGHSNTAVGYLAMGTTATNAGNSNVAIGYKTMQDVNDGFANTYVGTLSGGSEGGVSGNYNVGVGYQADKTRVGGEYNISIGYRTNEFQGLSGGQYSIAIGREASKHYGRIASGTYKQMGARIAIGSYAGAYMTSGDYSTIVGNNSYKGDSSVYNATASYVTTLGADAGFFATGSYNTFVGAWAARGGQTSAPYSSGEYNVAVGVYALQNFTTGDKNIAVGPTALGNISTGYRNIGIGDRAAVGTTTGHSGVYIGYLAGYGGNQGGNVAIGSEALFTANGGSNVAIGYETAKLTTANDGVWIGANAGKDGAGGGQSSIVGHYAGQYIVGSEVTLIGQQAGRYASGSRNTFVGAQAGLGGQTSAPYSSGQYNVAMGYAAFDAFTTGNLNVAIGYQALSKETIGISTVAIGDNAGSQQVFGTAASTYNTLVGSNAGFWNVTGTGNTYLGAGAGTGASGQSNNNNTAVGNSALISITTGNQNVALGSGAGRNITTGGNNVIIGRVAAYASTDVDKAVIIGEQAGYTGNMTSAADGTVSIGSGAGKNITSGQANVSVGFGALATEDTGDFNTAIGYQALVTQNRDGTVSNTAVGYKAGYAVTTGYEATLVGANAGVSLTEGIQNTLIGGNVADALTTGDFNTAVGARALNSEDVGRFTTAIGYQAGYHQNSDSNDEDTGNTLLGASAGFYNVTGTNNTLIGRQAGNGTSGNSYSNATAVGYKAGYSLTTGGITAFGYQAGYSSTTGGGVHIGYQAGYSQTTGNANVSVGDSALYSNQTNVYNVAIGTRALYDLSGNSQDGNVAIGWEAGENAQVDTGTVMIGYRAGKHKTGHSSISIGYEAGLSSRSGGMIAIGRDSARGVGQHSASGVVIGYQAGMRIASGSTVAVTAIGYRAGHQMSGSNDFFGYNSGYGSVSSAPYGSGQFNVGVGTGTLYNLSTGEKNTVVGRGAGDQITTGPRNTLLGYEAGDTITTGEQNILIGHGADVTSTAGSNRIGIGHNVVVGTDNTTVIGGAGQTKVTISGSGVELATHPHNNTTASFARFNVKSTSYTGIIDMPQDSYTLRMRGPLGLELHGTQTTLYNSSRTGNSLLRLLYGGQPQIYAATGSFRILAGSSTIADGATGSGGGGFGFHWYGSDHQYIFATRATGGDNNNRGVQFHNRSSGIYTGSLRIESTAARDTMVLKNGGVYLGRQGGNSAMLDFKATNGPTINMLMGLSGIAVTGTTGGSRMTAFRFSGKASTIQFDTDTQGGDIYFQQSTGSLNDPVRGGVIIRQQDSTATNGTVAFFSCNSTGPVIAASDHGGSGNSINSKIQFRFGGVQNNSNVPGVYYPAAINSSGSYSGSIDSFGQFGTDLILASPNKKKLQFGSNDTAGGVEVSSGVMEIGDVEDEDAITQIQLKVYGSTDLQIDDEGTTKPRQPAFLAHAASTQTNISSGTTVNFATEVYDVRNNYNNSSSTFTAPLTGKYLLGFHLRLQSIDLSASRYWIQINTSNRNYVTDMFTSDTNAFDGDLAYWSVGGTVVADMDASDTATISLHQTGGSAQTDVYGTSSPQSRFYGYLLG